MTLPPELIEPVRAWFELLRLSPPPMEPSPLCAPSLSSDAETLSDRLFDELLEVSRAAANSTLPPAPMVVSPPLFSSVLQSVHRRWC